MAGKKKKEETVTGEQEETVINSDIRSGDKTVDTYIKSLEDWIKSFDTSNIKRLIVAADLFSAQVANDMGLIATGNHKRKEKVPVGVDPNTNQTLYETIEVSNLNILSDDKDDKTFERLMVIITKIKDFKLINDMVTSMKPEEVEKASNENKSKAIQLDTAKNAYEQLLEKVRQDKLKEGKL